MKRKRVMVDFTESQHNWLKMKYKESGNSMCSIVRNCVMDKIKKEEIDE